MIALLTSCSAHPAERGRVEQLKLSQYGLHMNVETERFWLYIIYGEHVSFLRTAVLNVFIFLYFCVGIYLQREDKIYQN